MIILEDSEIQKYRCFNVNLAKKDLEDLAFNGLPSHIKEKLEGNDFFLLLIKCIKELWLQKAEAKSCKKVIGIIVPTLMLFGR